MIRSFISFQAIFQNPSNYHFTFKASNDFDRRHTCRARQRRNISHHRNVPNKHLDYQMVEKIPSKKPTQP